MDFHRCAVVEWFFISLAGGGGLTQIVLSPFWARGGVKRDGHIPVLWEFPQANRVLTIEEAKGSPPDYGSKPKEKKKAPHFQAGLGHLLALNQ